MLVCGVDEAGRGSMIGPLVVAGISIEKSKIDELAEMGVKDSKKLTPAARSHLYKKITSLVDDYAVSRATPKMIDDSVARHQLNHLEAVHMARVIKKLAPSVSYVDSCDVNQERFGREIHKMSRTGKVRSYHHADSKFVVVSAASIVAKVTRDRAIERISRLYDVGSGYPSDDRTVRFVREWFLANGQVPTFVRKSWAPVKVLLSS